MSNPLIQYWDSDVLIHAIQRTPEHIANLEPLISDAESGNLQILLSTFSLMEVYKDLDGKNATSKEDDELIVAFFENPYFIIRDLTEPIALMARQISREFTILPKDAVHIATSLYFKVPVLFSYDEKLLNKNGKIGDPPLEIIQPTWKGQPTLAGMDVEQGAIEEQLDIATQIKFIISDSSENIDIKKINPTEILLLEQNNGKENSKPDQKTKIGEQPNIRIKQEG